MINHVRTLLLNISGSSKPDSTYPGEEYAPPEYTAINLSNSLSRVRSLLFGGNADRAMYNYRLAQLLTLVHSCELEQYITALDSRITYWPLHKTDLFSTFGSSISALTESTWSIKVLGGDATQTTTGALLNDWKVEVLDTSSVKVTRQIAPHETATSSYVFSGSYTQPISLPGSSLTFVMTQGGATLPTWHITHLSKPLLTLPDLYVLLSRSADVEGLFDDTEPYKTCKALWQMPSGSIAYKLGAVVVALAYRINEALLTRLS